MIITMVVNSSTWTIMPLSVKTKKPTKTKSETWNRTIRSSMASLKINKLDEMVILNLEKWLNDLTERKTNKTSYNRF